MNSESGVRKKRRGQGVLRRDPRGRDSLPEASNLETGKESAQKEGIR
jgi:hypothetical protein